METAREISREIDRAVEGWQEYADRRERDEEDDSLPVGPILSPPLAIALGLAVFIVPQLIVPGPATEAWRYVPLFLIPVVVSMWGLRLVSVVGGALVVGGSFVAAQAAAMLTGRVFTYLPHATQGLVAPSEAARLAFVAAGVFTAATLSLLIVFGRRLARPGALTQAVLFGLGLPALAAGLAYGFWETQHPNPSPWLAFVFYALWLSALAQGLFATATTRMSALLGGWRPPRGRDGQPVRATRRSNNSQVWLVALLTLIGIGVVTVVTVGPPIPFSGRAHPATNTAPPF